MIGLIKSNLIVKSFLFPVYATTLIGFGHYVYFIFSSVFVEGTSFGKSLFSLIDGGWLFVLMNFWSWFLLSVFFTPILVMLLTKNRASKKLLLINFVASFLLCPVMVSVFFLIHLVLDFLSSKPWVI